MPSVAGMTEWLASYSEIYHQDAVWEGFVSGLAVGFVLPVGALLVWWLILYRRRKCRAICVPGEGGNLIISSVAIREFMQRIVADFRDLELLGVTLRRRSGMTDISVRVNAVSGSNVKATKDALKERIRAEASEKLGLEDLLGDIHIDVIRLSASEHTIAKKARRIQRQEPTTLPAPVEVTEKIKEAEEKPTAANEPLAVSE